MGSSRPGHPRGSIIVWDRSLGGIKEAGYRLAVDGYQLKAIAPRDGYDPKAVLSAPLIGKLVWGDLEYSETRKNTAAFRHREYEQRESFFQDRFD